MSEVYEYGPYRQDSFARTLMRNAELIAIGPKAFDTLLYLVTNAGRTVSREEIIQAVWPDTFVEEGNLTYNISQLRKILGEYEPGLPYIQTLPKQGYRFIANVSQVSTNRQQRTARRYRRWLAGTSSPRMVVASAIAILVLGAAGAFWLRARNPEPAAVQVTFDENAFNTEPALSPDRKWIAFASNRSGEGNMDLWIVPAPGGTPRRLTHGEINARQPEFSPDSKTIVYRSDRVGGGLFRIPADGSGEPVAVVRGGFRPRFSPNGNQLVYWDGVDTSTDLVVSGGSKAYIISADGGVPRQICPEFAAVTFPIWSPDGTKILFLGRRSPAEEFGRLSTFWFTPANECRPTPILGTQADWPDYYDKNNPLLIPGRWLSRGNLIYSVEIHNLGLTEVSFSEATGRVSRPSSTLPLPIGGLTNSYVVDAHSLVFSDSVHDADLWRLSLDSVGSVSEAELAVRCGGEVCLPALSSDGSVLFYSRATKDTVEFIRRDLHSGTDERVASAKAGAIFFPFVIGPRDRALYATSNGSGEHQSTLTVREYRASAPRAVCSGCILFWDISPTGRYALAMAGSELRRVDLFDTQLGTLTPLLAHSQWNLYWAAFSPDEKDIVFCAKVTPGRCQLFIGGFNAGHTDPISSWIPITSASEYNGPAHWSPDGTRIYFTSDRDGYRCLYAQQWNQTHRQLVGSVIPVRHFHASSPSPGLIDQPVFEFAVARDKIVMEMGSRKGNIWLVR